MSKPAKSKKAAATAASASAPAPAASSTASAAAAAPSSSSSASPSPSSLTPHSSVHDPHVYRHITLPNGLSALLVVDRPKTPAQRAREEAAKKRAAKKQSAGAAEAPAASADDGEDDESKPAVVALSVRVGHWSDPDAIPGLAHFCEHMLFMGNKQYPNENEWEEYLSEHGGASNAFTDSEHTAYYFEVNPKFLQPSLERFSAFFISPLFASSATKREIRAVDSEFRDCLNNDGARMEELMNATAANKQHPFAKWGWGNIDSLENNLKPKKIVQSKTAKAKGKPVAPAAPTVDLRAELKAFYARYYSSHAMKLVVYQAGGKLDKLESWVSKLFAPVVHNGMPLNDFGNFGSPFVAAANAVPAAAAAAAKPASKAAPSVSVAAPPATCLQQMYFAVPIKEMYKLSLSWIITPSLQQHYALKPLHYAEHLLGHESAGSLYQLLRGKGLITGLTAGVNESGNHKNTSFECMQLTLSMTKDGSQRINEILDFVFQYLALIRQPANIRESVYRELQSLAEIGFIYGEAQDPSEMVQDLAINLQVYPPMDVVRGDFIHEAFSRELTTLVLNQLTVQNCRIDIAVPSNKDRPSLQKAPWFGTQWDSEPLAPELVKQFARYDSQPKLIDAALHLPAPNAFVPTDFVIARHASAEDARKQLDNAGPQLIVESAFGEVWWHLDETFSLPRAHVNIILESPAVYSSAANVALTELLVKLWVDSVNEYAYQASLAELEFSLDNLRSGIEFKASGFHHQLPAFVAAVMKGLADLESFLNKPDAQTRFDGLLEKTARFFMHRYFTPIKQAGHTRLCVLQQQKFAVEDITAACKSITKAQLIAHVRALLSSVRVVCLVDGNVTKANAAAMFKSIEYTLCATSKPAPPRQELTLRLPAGHCVFVEQRARNPRESNHSTEMYFQVGQSTLFTRAVLNLLEALVAEPGFDQLRTKEQLGYQVQSGVRNTHGILGFIVAIQSAAFDPHHLAARIESFLWNTFYPLLLSMPAAKFETHRSALVAEYLFADSNLGERVDRVWEEITESRSYCFGRPALMAKHVAAVTHDQVVQLFEHFFLGIAAEPPVPSDSSAMIIDDSRLSASPPPEEAAVASVSALQLDPSEEEAKRKEERKQAKKQRKAAAAASKGAASSTEEKDPAVEAAVVERVAAAKLKPVLYRRRLIVSVFGNANAKKSPSRKAGASAGSSDETKEGEDEDMGSEDGEDEEGEDDDEDEDDGSADGSDGDASGADGEDATPDPNAPPHVDSLWLSAEEWAARLEEQSKKETENAAVAAVQPPTKKQKNGNSKSTHTHASSAAAPSPTSASSAANAALFAAFPPPAEALAVRWQDSLSVGCPCTAAAAASSASASVAPTAVPSASFQVEHAPRVRTFDALLALKQASPFFPFSNGAEPDLPAQACAKR